MTPPLHERLRILLEQCELDGALLLVFRKPDQNGKPVVTYQFALNGMLQQEAIGNLLAGISDMLISGLQDDSQKGGSV